MKLYQRLINYIIYSIKKNTEHVVEIFNKYVRTI